MRPTDRGWVESDRPLPYQVDGDCAGETPVTIRVRPGAARDQPEPPPMPKIPFAASGETHEVPAGTSFLEFCQDSDADHDFGCTVGSCGTCRLEITEGAGNVSPITDEERETVEMCTGVEGARLGCQLVVNGDIAVRPVD